MYRHPFSSEPDIIFTIIDFEELIQKHGVKNIIAEMSEETISKLNEGIKAHYIRKANERLNGNL